MSLDDIVKQWGRLAWSAANRYASKVSGIEADDLWTVAILGIWKSWPRFDPDRSKPSTWAWNCAWSAMMHERRDRQRDYRGVDAICWSELPDIDMEKIGFMIDLSPSVTDVVIASDTAERLWETVDGLGGKRSEVIRRHYKDGETYQSIAKSWGNVAQNAQNYRAEAIKTLALEFI